MQVRPEFRSNINHAEEIDEIFGNPPSKVVHWSIISVAIFLLLLITAGFIVKYTEVVRTKIFIRATTSPKPVVPRTTGKIIKLFVRENNMVTNNEILGYIESIADHRQIIELSEELNRTLEYVKNNNWDKLYDYNPAAYSSLGELQVPHQLFVSNVMKLKAYLKGGGFDKSIILIKKEIGALKQLEKNLQGQEEIYKSDYQLTIKEFGIKETLYNEKVIALMEYNQDKSKLLGKQIPLKNIENSIINNKTATIAKEQELLSIKQNFETEKGNFIQSLNTLISNIDSWKKQYLLLAPVGGRVVFSNIIQENQIASVGEELFYISPQSKGYVGQMFVSQEGMGKIEVGQSVLINVASYPSHEYGKLKGKIVFISSVPNKDMEYLITVKLNSELLSDRNVNMNFRNNLLGSAEIITRKTRLINRLLFSFKKLLDNHLTK